MRDIRADLRDRLAVVNGREADEMAEYVAAIDDLNRRHQAMMAEIERERDAVKQLLAIEERRAGGPTTTSTPAPPLVSLSTFLIMKIQTCGPMDKDTLRSEAEMAGYFKDSNGRTFHTTLMNITNGGKLTALPDGRYACPSQQPDMLSDKEIGSRAIM